MESETSEKWLPIIEYSVKTGVSLSTIRRKIKSNSIPYRLEKGKYFIQFGAVPNEPVFAMPIVQTIVSKPAPPVAPKTPEDPVRMMTDAFEYALKEKEERIRLLERRNQDLESHLDELRLLVHVLEEKYEVRY